MVTKTPKYLVKKIDTIVRRIVEEEMPRGLTAEDVCVVAHEDPFGDETVFVYVVYRGNRKFMDYDWTTALPRKVRERLRGDERDVVIFKYFIYTSEWPSYYKHNVAPWIQKTS